MMLSRALVGLCALSACAVAGKAGGTPDAHKFGTDGPNNKLDSSNSIDAFVFHDSPSASGPVTLTETGDNTIAAGATVSCNNGTTTADNIWYRAFQLSDYSISNALSITGVTFAIEECASAGTITIKIGSYSGTLDGSTLNSAMISSLATATTSPADSTGGLVTVPITATIPAGGKFVVEVSAPNNTTGYFVLGSTNATETHYGYWSSSACSQTTPETTMAAGQTNPQTNLIINVAGTH